MKDINALKELVVSQVRLVDLMLAYNVKFIYNPKNMDEVQLSCPFHGADKSPSARLYNTTDTCFCWTCRKRWDVISFVMDKEGHSFVEAIKSLIKRFRIDTSSIPDDPIMKEERVVISDENVKMLFLKNCIQRLRQKMPFEKYRALTLAYCMISYARSMGQDITSGIKKLENKLSVGN